MSGALPLFVKLAVGQKMSVFGLGHICIGPKAATWSNFVALIIEKGINSSFQFYYKKKDIELFPYAKLQCNFKIKYLPT